MRKEDFYFDLPEELIAQDPLEDRSSSRLLVLDKSTGEVEHHVFRDVLDYLEEGDCLVINDTKVLPARLIGSKVGTDAKIEVLFETKRTPPVGIFSTGGCFIHYPSTFRTMSLLSLEVSCTVALHAAIMPSYHSVIRSRTTCSLIK